LRHVVLGRRTTVTVLLFRASAHVTRRALERGALQDVLEELLRGLAAEQRDEVHVRRSRLHDLRVRRRVECADELGLDRTETNRLRLRERRRARETELGHLREVSLLD